MAEAEDTTRDLLAALHAILPLLERARLAYQFNATAYTYDALMACGQAGDLARAAIRKAGAAHG